MNKNFTKKIVSVASAVAIMGTLAVPAFAASTTPVTGKTNVFYTSESVVPGPDGTKWGVKIPSGVALSNAKTSVNGDEYGIALVSMDPNERDLTKIYATLQVSGTVESANDYKFTKSGVSGGTAVGAYTYNMNNKTFTKTDKELPTLSIETGKNKFPGTFTLTKKILEKGEYTDTLTFTFTEKTASFIADAPVR